METTSINNRLLIQKEIYDLAQCDVKYSWFKSDHDVFGKNILIVFQNGFYSRFIY